MAFKVLFLPIETAPKDGRQVWVVRKHDGRVITEGWARWGTLAGGAPLRQLGEGGLDGPIPPDADYADTEHWVTVDGLHSFPPPTHWSRARTFPFLTDT